MNEKWWRVPSKQIQVLKKPCRRLILFLDDFRTSRPNPQKEKRKKRERKRVQKGRRRAMPPPPVLPGVASLPKTARREREKERERTDCHEESELVPLLYIYAPNAKPL